MALLHTTSRVRSNPSLLTAVVDFSQLTILLGKCSAVSYHGLIPQVDENEPATGYQTPTSPPKSELALQKGFRRRTWTGPAWLDNVTSTGHVRAPSLLPHHPAASAKAVLLLRLYISVYMG